MKKIFAVMIILLGATVAMAADSVLNWPTTTADPVAVANNDHPVGATEYARAFLKHGKTLTYRGYLAYDVVENNISTHHEASFYLDEDGLVSQFELDGETIWSILDGDEAIPGIPFPIGGQFVNLYVTLSGFGAMNSAGHLPFTRYGNFETDLLVPGDPVVVTMRPAQIQVPVYLAADVLPAGTDMSHLAIRFAGENYPAAYWANGKFLIWVDPLSPPASYEVYDYVTGLVFYTGVPFVYGNNNPVAGGNAAVNQKLEGGVTELDFDRSPYLYLSNQSFRSFDWNEAGQYLEADSVFMAYLDGRQLSCHFYGVVGRVTVELIKADGLSETVAYMVMDPENDGVMITIQPGYEKVILKLTGGLPEGSYGASFVVSGGDAGAKG